MQPQYNNPELLKLLDALCNEQLTAEQWAQLQNKLRDDAAAQQAYLDYIDLHIGLKHVVNAESGGRLSDRTDAPVIAKPRKQYQSRNMLHTIFAAWLIVAVGIVVALFQWTQQNASTPLFAVEIIDVAGKAEVIASDGKVRAASTGMRLAPGERIESTGPGAVAIVEYQDGTRLALVNDAAVTCLADKGLSVQLHHGVVSALVAPQPAGRPMLLVTPEAKVEVLGTRFAIAAAGDRTELNVAEGRVRLTRNSDGKSVEVTGGRGVVAVGREPLEVRNADAPGDNWEVDFERGVPDGWIGQSVFKNLPAGSAGAVGSIAEKGSDPQIFMLASRDEWVAGMFTIHDDTHLHITLKMESPNWLNIFLSTRGSDATKPTWALHNFNKVPFWPPKPGQWRTVTIPLAEFRRKRDGVFHNEPPILGEVAYSLSITSTAPDRGLVIDRMWVTRGGPGKVESKPLP